MSSAVILEKAEKDLFRWTPGFEPAGLQKNRPTEEDERSRSVSLPEERLEILRAETEALQKYLRDLPKEAWCTYPVRVTGGVSPTWWPT